MIMKKRAMRCDGVNEVNRGKGNTVYNIYKVPVPSPLHHHK